MKQRHFIDTHKGATPLAIVGMMALHRQWDNPTAWIYLALHGTYALLWVVKSRVYPDPSWERRTGIAHGLLIWAVLTLYWIAPWIVMSRGVRAPAPWLSVCVALAIVGTFLHFAADLQKHTALNIRPGVLITDGLFARCRNPNYLGELLLYLGFALLARHWLPIVALGTMVGGVWVPNMVRKDRSLSRYPEFAEYRDRSALLIPFVL